MKLVLNGRGGKVGRVLAPGLEAAGHELVELEAADAMVDFTADRLKVYPTKVAPEETRATVRTEVKRSNGTKVAVNYTMRKVNSEWKAWDVVIDGISYVKSYREDYGAEVQQKGLDAVIARLEAKAASARAAKVKSG